MGFSKSGWHPQPKRASSFPQSWGMSKKLVFFARFWEVLVKRVLVAEGLINFLFLYIISACEVQNEKI